MSLDDLLDWDFVDDFDWNLNNLLLWSLHDLLDDHFLVDDLFDRSLDVDVVRNFNDSLDRNSSLHQDLERLLDDSLDDDCFFLFDLDASADVGPHFGSHALLDNQLSSVFCDVDDSTFSSVFANQSAVSVVVSFDVRRSGFSSDESLFSDSSRDGWLQLSSADSSSRPALRDSRIVDVGRRCANVSVSVGCRSVGGGAGTSVHQVSEFFETEGAVSVGVVLVEQVVGTCLVQSILGIDLSCFLDGDRARPVSIVHIEVHSQLLVTELSRACGV